MKVCIIQNKCRFFICPCPVVAALLLCVQWHVIQLYTPLCTNFQLQQVLFLGASLEPEKGLLLVFKTSLHRSRRVQNKYFYCITAFNLMGSKISDSSPTIQVLHKAVFFSPFQRLCKEPLGFTFKQMLRMIFFIVVILILVKPNKVFAPHWNQQEKAKIKCTAMWLLAVFDEAGMHRFCSSDASKN